MTLNTSDATGLDGERAVYVVDGCRSAFLKFRGKPGPFTASELAVQAGRSLLLRQPFEANDFDEVILGCVGPSPDETNIGRVVALRLGCGDKMPAWTVQRNCASGMQAVDSAHCNIATGRTDLALAGGVEAMSHAPLLFNKAMVNWLAAWNTSKTLASKLQILTRFRPSFLAPVIALLRGLRDPLVGLSMGQTAENLAWRFGIDREQMDIYAVESHQRLRHAQASGYLNEIEIVYDQRGSAFASDDGVRPDSSVEKLASLKPVFDKKFGSVTAGNSAQVSDGAAWLILASEDAVRKHNLEPIGRIIDSEWAGLDPAQMGLGPVHAVSPLLERHKITPQQIDYWELNEAFAAQVLACLAAWKDPGYCRNELGLNKSFGEVPLERLNVDGGGISLGHPVGASGTRIILHLLEVLKRNNANRGVATLCVGGGQGGAVLLENMAN